MKTRFFALLLALGACAPVPLGGSVTNPYDLDTFPTFTSKAGSPLFGQRRYNETRWRAVSRSGAGLFFDFSLTLEFGTAPALTTSAEVRAVFGDPVTVCSNSGQGRRVDAQAPNLAVLAAPPGWNVRLERASNVLECGETRTQGGDRVLRFRTYLELLYAFDIPAGTPVGTYPVRWQVTDASGRFIASEDRRFVVAE